MKLASLAMLWHPLAILVGTAVACYVWATTADPGTALAWLKNPGPHGFSEMLYEFTSSAANNGSGFEGLGDNTPFWNISTGMVMLLSRYIPIIAPLALAGFLGGEAGGAGNHRIAARRQRDLRRHAVGRRRHSRPADVHAGGGARPDRRVSGARLKEGAALGASVGWHGSSARLKAGLGIGSKIDERSAGSDRRPCSKSNEACCSPSSRCCCSAAATRGDLGHRPRRCFRRRRKAA